VKRGASLGANSTIVCGVTIGRYAFVGAGAVVTHDVQDHALVVGVPARRVGWVCKCGVRLEDSNGVGICRECGATYMIEAGVVTEIRNMEVRSKRAERTLAASAGSD
jgi:UDP-2-acetamido-3-amino-2,3-dideoxy-glucuronate N-acetyltransferase